MKKAAFYINKEGRPTWKLSVHNISNLSTEQLEAIDVDHIYMKDVFYTEVEDIKCEHVHKVSLKEIQDIINTEETLKKELLHIIKKHDMIILDEIMWFVYDGPKTWFNVALKEFVTLRNRVLTELRERKAHQYRNARIYRCCIDSNSIPASNLFDDVFKIIENM